MFVEERKEKIISILKSKEKVSVNELSKLFNISKVIVRKDLTALENDGIITRTHGGAILKRKLVKSVILKDIEREDFEEKVEIAEKAVSLLKEDDVIFLDNSTINLVIASILQKNRFYLTVITNMLEIYNLLLENKNIKLISLGGEYDSRTNAFIGELAKENLKKFNPTKVFIGTGGINLDKKTLSTPNLEEGNFKNTALNIGNEKFILSQSKKFYQDCIYNFATLSEEITIITTKNISSTILLKLEELDIKVIK